MTTIPQQRSGNSGGSHSIIKNLVPFRPFRPAGRPLVDRYPFDAEYLRRLRDGEPDTVTHFFKYFTKKLKLKLSTRRGLTMSDADDAIQETFARVFATLRKPNGITSPESFGAFVFRVCDICLLEDDRVKRVLEPLDDNYDLFSDPNPDILQHLLKNERRADVQHTLKKMKPMDRAILTALWIEEQPKDDVCARYGIKREYLRVVVHRAIARFRFLFPKG